MTARRILNAIRAGESPVHTAYATAGFIAAMVCVPLILAILGG